MGKCPLQSNNKDCVDCSPFCAWYKNGDCAVLNLFTNTEDFQKAVLAQLEQMQETIENLK